MSNEDTPKTYIYLLRGAKTDEVMKYAPAFMLLSQIALRARRTDRFNIEGLSQFEAELGDHKSIGISRSQYRTAIEKLKNWKIIAIRTTNRGTIAKLLDQSIFDINAEVKSPTETPSDSHQIATNNNDNKEKKERINNRLSINSAFFFNHLDATNLTGPFIELIEAKHVNSYLRKSIKHRTLSESQTRNLLKYFLRFILKPANEYRILKDILVHWIRWVEKNLSIPEVDSKNNYLLEENKRFWTIFHSSLLEDCGTTEPEVQSLNTSLPNAEVICAPQREPNKKAKSKKSLDDTIVSLKYSEKFRQRIIESIKESPPLSHCEVFGLMDAIRSFDESENYCGSEDDLVAFFICRLSDWSTKHEPIRETSWFQRLLTANSPEAFAKKVNRHRKESLAAYSHSL